MEVSSTPYDDVFRTLLNDCAKLILAVLNEIFGMQYTGKERIVFLPNEHFLNQQDGNEEKRITDSCFAVVGEEGGTRKYHIESQSTPDNSMLVRMFEYDTQIALDGGEFSDNALVVTFPHSGVLMLRHTGETPDRMRIRMVTPAGELEYDVPVMKVQRYSIDEIMEKKLYFLIPFYIFTHESRFKEYQENESQLSVLLSEYRKIREKLEELQEAGEISVLTKQAIIDMGKKVVRHLAAKYERVAEGVESVMGGKILEYEAKAIRDEGRTEGENRLSRLMAYLLKNGKTEEAVAVTESEALREELYKKYGIA